MKKNLLRIYESNGNELAEGVIENIVSIERQMQELKAKQDDLKAQILRCMEEHDILKIDNNFLTISYIAETDRETFDTKGFRAEYPELYDDFVKISTVKPSVRIKVK